MNEREFAPAKESLLERMRQENYSPGVLQKTNWVLDHFKNYCDKQGLEEITISAASDFVLTWRALKNLCKRREAVVKETGANQRISLAGHSPA